MCDWYQLIFTYQKTSASTSVISEPCWRQNCHFVFMKRWFFLNFVKGLPDVVRNLKEIVSKMARKETVPRPTEQQSPERQRPATSTTSMSPTVNTSDIELVCSFKCTCKKCCVHDFYGFYWMSTLKVFINLFVAQNFQIVWTAQKLKSPNASCFASELSNYKLHILNSVCTEKRMS